MKIAFKLLKLLVILILVVSVILFTAARIWQDKVSEVILKSLNNKISTKLKTGSIRLSFINKFPKASLELRDVLVYSSPDFNRSQFTADNTDTLLAARVVSVEFSLTDILVGNYNIERIRAKDGKVNFFTDKSGDVNYDIYIRNEKPSSGETTINLDKVYLSEIRAHYRNLATDLIIDGIVGKGTLRSRIKGENIGFNAEGDVKISSIRLLENDLAGSFPASVDIDLRKDKYGIKFSKGKLRSAGIEILLGGSIASDNIYDLKITGKEIDLADIVKILPDKYKEKAAGYEPEGLFSIDCTVRGLMTRTSNPHVEITMQLKNGKITYASSNLEVNSFTFDGFYTNGAKNRPETGYFTLRDFRAKVGSANYQGSFNLIRLNDPVASLRMKGKILPAEIKELFNIKNITDAGGTVDFDVNLTGSPDLRKKKYEFSLLDDLQAEGELIFNSFTLGLTGWEQPVSGVTGTILLADLIRAKDLHLIYKGQKVTVDGEFINLLPWLDGKAVRMTATGDVHFNKLIPEAFTKSSGANENPLSGKKAFRLPDDLALDIDFRIDTLIYKKFSSSGISGTLNYKPNLLTFKSFNMKALKGTISGNGFILQNNNKTVLSKGIFNVTNVDVNKAFTAFENFGQDFLRAENIAGSLSGNFSLLLPMDSLLNPEIRSLTAEGKYQLLNGGLIDFEPVKHLSSFIEVSELENISFQKMENDFFIRNNFLYIPQMEVRSSAVDLSVNGKHSLDNDYEYHVKVLLSEILSRQRKKNRHTVTEFGAVEDDGLGRTSMLLKIVNKGEDIKVSYDMKAAAAEVKNNMKAEKKSLKKILNEEYGWYKEDSVKVEKPAEKKSRFRVTWDDK